MTRRGRRSRVVLAPRCWRYACEDASHHAGNGGKQARSPGRSRISRKPIAQGRPDVSAEPVVLPRAFCCTRTMGVSRHPAFPAPSVSDEGGSNRKTRTPCAARMRTHILSLVMPAKAGIQYAAASRLKHNRLWNTGSPDQVGRRQRRKGREHDNGAHYSAIAASTNPLGSSKNSRSVL
jgi:hypothetical protein